MNTDILKDLKGRTKAALLLAFLPLSIRRQIMSYLDDYEKGVMIKEVTNLPPFGADIIEAVLVEYISYIKGNYYGIVKGGAEEAISMLEGNVSEQEMQEFMKQLYEEDNRVFDTLLRLNDVSQLATFLQNEDYQTIALVMTYMKPPQAAELLQQLPTAKQDLIVMSIAKMEQTNPDAVRQIDRLLKEKLEAFQTEEVNTTDSSLKKLVNVLNNVNRTTEKSLFERLEKIDPRLTQEIKDSMFVFEDIIVLDNFSMQKVINKIPTDEMIAMALKTAGAELKERFYQAMPEQRQRMVDDVAEGLRVTQQNSEDAQQKIANIVKRLEEEDPNFIIPRGEDDVII